MLPPVFYVQQLEQILLRKLLSPPTPANPARFAFCPRRALISVFSFSLAFFVLFSRVEPRPLISRVCVARRSCINIWFSRFSVFLGPYFRRFYDFFLRRKYLESLVRVIRPFGVHLCATKTKKFRLDIFARRIIMKIERDAATSGRPSER